MRLTAAVAMVLSLLGAACGGEEREAGESEGADHGGMQGMAMPSMDMLPAVRVHLDSVIRAEPAELPGMVATHRERMEQMFTAMHRDMQAMNMSGDAAWQALEDSVRGDLRAIRGLSGEELVLRMRSHAGRMRRLLAMHERMMGEMGM
jgi:hypothetical protein